MAPFRLASAARGMMREIHGREAPMHVDGSCFCGHVTFEAEVDPGSVLACHCTDCQTLSSSAFRLTVPALPGTFRLLTGEVRTFVKIADSGNRRSLGFCPQCGTSIYSAPAGELTRDTFFGLRIGTLRQRRQLPPRKQYWTRSRQHWLDEIPGLESFEAEEPFRAR